MTDEISRCRFCNQPVLWAKTKEGRLMSVNHVADSDGNLVLVRRGGEFYVQVGAPTPYGTRYRPHFATCPRKAEWVAGGR